MGFGESLDKELFEARLVELIKGKYALMTIMLTKKYIFCNWVHSKLGGTQKECFSPKSFSRHYFE